MSSWHFRAESLTSSVLDHRKAAPSISASQVHHSAKRLDSSSWTPFAFQNALRRPNRGSDGDFEGLQPSSPLR